MKKLIMLAGAAALFTTPAFADLAGELATAQTHAGMAATQADIAMGHTHLQLVEVGALPQPGLHHVQALREVLAGSFQHGHLRLALPQRRGCLQIHGRLRKEDVRQPM
jgi:hypothetical protein